MTDSPLILAGTGSRSWRSMTITMAALEYAAGGREDVLLRTGDCYSGGDIMMRTGALRLGWLRPVQFAADWNRLGLAAGPVRNDLIAAATPKAHAGIALFSAALRNRGTLDCACKLVSQGIPVSCWCDECGPVPLDAPCRTHSLAEVLGTWEARTGRLLGT